MQQTLRDPGEFVLPRFEDCGNITTTANNKKGLRANGDLIDKRHPQKVLPTLLRELRIIRPDPAAPFARMTYLFPLYQFGYISQAIQRDYYVHNAAWDESWAAFCLLKQKAGQKTGVCCSAVGAAASFSRILKFKTHHFTRLSIGFLAKTIWQGVRRSLAFL